MGQGNLVSLIDFEGRRQGTVIIETTCGSQNGVLLYGGRFSRETTKKVSLWRPGEVAFKRSGLSKGWSD